MRRQIGWLVFATTSMVVASFVIPLCLLVQTMAADRARAAADQEARGIAILVAGLYDSPRLADLVDGLDQRSVPTTEVVLKGGRLLSGGRLAVGDPLRRGSATDRSLTFTDAKGYHVIVPVVIDDGAAIVRTTVSPEVLRQGVASAWAGIISVGLLLMGLALGLATWLARRVSEPLREVAAVAHELRAGDLTARAQPRGPHETQELARALNGLAERTAELLAAERAAVGDLSHRLRTPVTALRLDAEAVQDPALAERLSLHIGVLQRSIDAIVREARRPVASELAARCDLAEIVADRVTFWSALAEDQGRELSGSIDGGPLSVALAEADVRAMVDVLIDNVFAHTAETVPFRVDLTRSGGFAELVVRDWGRTGEAGPAGDEAPAGDEGPADREEVSRRPWRASSTSGSPEVARSAPLVEEVAKRPSRNQESPPVSSAIGGGLAELRVGSTGLGLDVARRTALSVGGTLNAVQVEQGFEVTVRLPWREQS